MKFASMMYVYMLPVVVMLLVGIFYWGWRKKKAYMGKMVGTVMEGKLTGNYSGMKRGMKVGMVLMGFVLGMLALGRPQFGHTWEEQHGRGIDILFVLDTSRSMLAEDVKPNRLERAKFGIMDLVGKLNGDRIGLVAFAGDAFLQCPMTLDYGAFVENLDAIEVGIIEQGGTDIAAAIRVAADAFPSGNNFKFIILITDGEELEEEGIIEARKVAKEGVMIYTVGVGSKGGELIPIRSGNGGVDYVRDAGGKVVKTRLDEETLKRIASATGGFYVALGSRGEGLEAVYEAGLGSIPKTDLKTSLRQVPIEYFQLPLGIGIILLLVEPLFSTRKSGWNLKKRTMRLLGKNLVLVVGLGLVMGKMRGSEATDGYKAYVKGDYERAVKDFTEARHKDLRDAGLPYNLGVAQYRKGDYEGAVHSFNDALAFNKLKEQGDAFYNLGNAYYRLGEETMKTNPQETVGLWENAVNNYEAVIDINKEDKEAKENLAFVKEQLAALKKKLEEEQKKEKEQQEKEKKSEEQKQKKEEEKKQEEQKKKEEKEQQENKDDKGNKDDGQSKENKDGEDKNEDSGRDKENKGKDGEKKDEKDKQNGKGDKKEGDQNVDKDKKGDEKGDQGGENKRELRKDGEMTKDEAMQILKAMGNDEKRMPGLGLEKGKGNGTLGVTKDW